MRKFFIMLIMLQGSLILPNEIDELDDMDEIPYTINVNINLANDNHSQSTNNSKIDTHQQTSLESTAKDMPDTFESIKSQISKSLADYKWHIGAALAISSYGLLCYYLIKGNSYLKRSELWSSWRQELSIDELLAIPHRQFMEDLTKEIQDRYEKDFTNSMILFMTALEQEEKEIRWYRSLYEWTSFFCMRKLTPCDSTSYDKCEQRLQRLAYYKGCINSLRILF